MRIGRSMLLRAVRSRRLAPDRRAEVDGDRRRPRAAARIAATSDRPMPTVAEQRVAAQALRGPSLNDDEQRAGVDRHALRGHGSRRPSRRGSPRSSFSIFIASTTTSRLTRGAPCRPTLHQDADDLARHRRHEPLRSRSRGAAPRRSRAPAPPPVEHDTPTGDAADVHGQRTAGRIRATLTSCATSQWLFRRHTVHQQRQRRARRCAPASTLPGVAVDRDCKTPRRRARRP